MEEYKEKVLYMKFVSDKDKKELDKINGKQ